MGLRAQLELRLTCVQISAMRPGEKVTHWLLDLWQLFTSPGIDTVDSGDKSIPS